MMQIVYIFAVQVMTCGNGRLVVNEKPFDQKRIVTFSKDVLKGKVLGFAQVDIEVPNQFYDKFSEMVPLFVVKEIPDCYIPEEIKIYQKKLAEKQCKEQKSY